MRNAEVGAKGIVYDGVCLSDIFEIHEVSMPVLPAVEAVAQEMAGRPGAYYQSRKVKTREVTMKLGLVAQSRSPLDISRAWRLASGVLDKPDPRPLCLGDDTYVMAMATGESPLEYSGYRGVAQVTFTCFDPFFYGPERTVELSSGDNEFYVLGACSTYPVVEITGVNGAFTLTDNRTGDKVRVLDLATATVLRIDMANYRCTVNGNYKKADMTVTDFWALEPGSACLRLSGGSGTLRYKERYL